MSECKLFSHIILGRCVYALSAGVVASSQREAQVMTVLGLPTHNHWQLKDNMTEYSRQVFHVYLHVYIHFTIFSFDLII